MIVLIKLLAHQQKVEEVRVNLGFANAFMVDRDGRSGV